MLQTVKMAAASARFIKLRQLFRVDLRSSRWHVQVGERTLRHCSHAAALSKLEDALPSEPIFRSGRESGHLDCTRQQALELIRDILLKSHVQDDSIHGMSIDAEEAARICSSRSPYCRTYENDI
jgi:hypothetical protein